jgi:hypothetical protein
METTIKVLSQDSDLNYDVLITVMRSGVNRNRWDYQNVAEYAHTFNSTPILCAYVNGQIADGHNMREMTMPDGEVAYDFTGATAERIVGAISDKPEDIEVRSDESGEWVIAKGKLWRFYNRQLVDHIAQVGTMEVSAETEVFESHMNEDVEVFTGWRGIGVTILNEKVAPAIPGANIKALQALESEFRELKLKVASHNFNEEEKQEEPLVVNETNNEPQQEINKGEKTVKVFSKNQVRDLAKKFEGYTVLSAGQDDNGIHVCLMSKEGATAIYDMQNIDDIVDARKIRSSETQAVFAGEDWEIRVDTAEISGKLSDSLVATQASLAEANTALEKANSTIESMTVKEMNRRLSAAKAKALATLEEFNANRMEKVDASVLTKINEAIENGDFSECENAEGEWCGEEEVANQVLAACAKSVMAMDKATAQKNNSQYIWEGLQTKADIDRGDVASLLASIPMLND